MLRTRLDLNNLRLNTYADGQDAVDEDARHLNTTRRVGPSFTMAKGVRASELKGRYETGKDSLPPKQAPPVAASVDPRRMNVYAETVQKEPRKNLLTRGFYQENPNETSEESYLQMWEPLQNVQGADRKGMGVDGGQEGLVDGSKAQVNAAPLKLFDYQATHANVEQKPTLRTVAVTYK